MSVPVSFFNASILPVTVEVNNGTRFSIPRSRESDFTPSLPASGGPTWDFAGPSQNVLGPGENYIEITPEGQYKPFGFPVELDTTTEYTSIQLYVFWNSNKDVNWIILNAGKFVQGSVTKTVKL